MKNALFIVIILLTLTSCESFCDSYIENDTDLDIIMIAKMDTTITRHYAVSRTDFLNSFANDSSSIKIIIDTNSYIGVYVLKSKAIIQIDGGLGDHPTSKFSYLQFRTKKDTVTYYSNKEIDNAFNNDKDPKDTKLTIN